MMNVIVMFGAICVSSKSANIDDLPQNVQHALELLSNHGLMSIGDAAASEPHVFQQIVGYWTENWEQSKCEWLNDDLPDSITNQWQYESSPDVITGPLVTWCDVEETFNPLYLSDIDQQFVPTHLYNEIAYLLSAEADGNQCLARLKYFVWSIYGIEWNADFVAKLGFNSDMDLFMTIGSQMSGLLQSGPMIDDILTAQKKGSKGASSPSEEPTSQCKLMEPALLMEPFFEPITQIYGELFDELEGSTATATASFGVRLCYAYEGGLCFGGGFGFAVNANRQGFLYRESILNAVADIHSVEGELITNGRSKQDQPSSTDAPQQQPEPSIYPTISQPMPSEPQHTISPSGPYPDPSMTPSQPQSTQSDMPMPSEPRSTQSAAAPMPSQPQSSQPMPSEPQSTQSPVAPMPSQPEPSIHPTMQPPVQSTQSTQSSMPQPSEPQQQPQPEPSSPNQPEPSQPASPQPPMPEMMVELMMHATFYIEFGIYDDIDSIHSVELERELNENYAGIWIVDPAVVYDADGAAVGVTFNAEVDISGRLSPGFPMGSIILDKVAELLTEEDGHKNGGGGGNGPDNVLAASNAHIIESKRVFEIDNGYYPVSIVCAAIGVTIVIAAKFYLKQFGKKEYEPLLG